MIYPGQHCGIPPTGSRDSVGTRICHANADADADMHADTNGTGTETNMSSSPNT